MRIPDSLHGEQEPVKIQKSREVKQFDEGRRKLLALEKEGKYVFHGSPDVIEVLEPRQAYNFNGVTGQQEKDGNPAVFATPYADAAIFRSLVNPRNVVGDSDSQFGMDEEGKLHFAASQNLLDSASGRRARIYVLDKTVFTMLDGTNCKSERSIAPLQVVEVTAEDLPDNIKVIG